jgi:hypothetical protein
VSDCHVNGVCRKCVSTALAEYSLLRCAAAPGQRVKLSLVIVGHIPFTSHSYVRRNMRRPVLADVGAGRCHM